MPVTKERADDPIRAYMKQMGQTELLTKEQEVEIFKRIEKAQNDARKILYKDHFNNGFDLYQNQKFGKALQLFNECYENVPEDKVSELYIERCEMLMSQGWNAETWNGINYMETK